MTTVDRIKCRYAHSGMTSGVGGFQNPGACLQAFPSFLTHPLPAYSRHFSRGLCSETARKRLLRREDTVFSFTCKDIGVAMVTNIFSQLQESFPLTRAAGSFEISLTKCPKWLRGANTVELLVTFSTSCQIGNRRYKYYSLYFSFITLYPSFITFL